MIQERNNERNQTDLRDTGVCDYKCIWMSFTTVYSEVKKSMYTRSRSRQAQTSETVFLYYPLFSLNLFLKGVSDKSVTGQNRLLDGGRVKWKFRLSGSCKLPFTPCIYII